MTTTLDSVSLQAAFQKHFNRALAEGVHDGIFGKNEKLNPKIAIDSMVKALKDVGAEQGVIDGIKDLKADDYVDKFINDFDESMKNEKIDSSNIFAKKPDFKLEEALAIAAKGEGISDLDLFLAGAEKHGKGVATRAYGAYSKYGDLKKITEPLRLEKNVNDALKYVDGIDPALKTKHYDQLYKRSNKPYTVDLGSGKKITVKPRKHEFQSAMDKVYDALDEQDNYANQLKADKASKFGKFKSKAGAIGGPLASIGGGAYGIVSSNQALVDLEQRLKDGEITQEEHDFQETQVKLGQASSGMMVATGVAQGAGEIAKKITKYSAKHGIKNIGVSGAKTAARFAPAAGDLLAMGMSAVALAQNAMSADKARREGNHDRAAMYGVMATLDSVNVVLNGVAFVCDLIPGIGNVISIGLNLAAAGLDVVKNLIGVFAEMVDTRSDDDKIQERFDAYVGSDAFKSHIDDLAASYKRAGFDVFQYEIDSDAAGIDGTEEGHKKIAAHSVLRKLTTEAKDSTNVKDLRQAIINNTGETKEYDLGKGDDLIRLLNGKGVKTVYAGEGDDELISIKGNHNLFGGLGDDLLIAHEGTGTLDGGAGDDTIIKYKGDGLINGGEGNDRAFAGWGEEKIEAGSGDDVVFGGGGDDAITGGAGKDSISGGLGDDSMEGGSGDDNYATGLGVDTISDTQGKNSVTLRALNQVEAILARESRNLNWEVKHRLKYPKFGYTVKLESDKKSSIRADIEKHRIEKQFELVRETGSGDSKYVYRETVNGIDQLFSSNSYRDKKKMGDFNLSYAHRFELDYDFLKGLSKTKLN